MCCISMDFLNQRIMLLTATLPRLTTCTFSAFYCTRLEPNPISHSERQTCGITCLGSGVYVSHFMASYCFSRFNGEEIIYVVFFKGLRKLQLLQISASLCVPGLILNVLLILLLVRIMSREFPGRTRRNWIRHKREILGYLGQHQSKVKR